MIIEQSQTALFETTQFAEDIKAMTDTDLATSLVVSGNVTDMEFNRLAYFVWTHYELDFIVKIN